MPRANDQKKKLFALYQILYEYTDDNNGLTMTEILSKLQNRGILAERRSIYDDFWLYNRVFRLKRVGLFQQGPHAHRAHGQGGREELTKRRIKNQPAPLPERTGAPPCIRPAAARLRPPPGAACGGALVNGLQGGPLPGQIRAVRQILLVFSPCSVIMIQSMSFYQCGNW